MMLSTYRSKPIRLIRYCQRRVSCGRRWVKAWILSVLFFLSGPTSLLAQSKILITGQYEQKSLKEIVYAWESSYEVFFSFKPQLLKGYKITLELDEIPLTKALEQLLTDTELDYEIRQGRFVLLTPRKKEMYLCGWIVDSLSGDPVPYANVWTQAGRKGRMSQTDGSFYLKGPFAPNEKIHFSHIGYKAFSLPLADLINRPCANVFLAPKAIKIQDVTISEYLTDGISHDHASIQLQPKRVATLPGLTEPDLFQMVQVLPGVNNPDETANGLHIRGGTPDQTLVLHNDIPLYQTGHLFGMISAINPYGVDQAKLFRSNYGASQIGRVSGVLAISQGEYIPAQAQWGANLNLTHAAIDVKTPFSEKKGAFFASVRRSLTDFLPSIPFNRLQDRVFQGTRLGYEREVDELIHETDRYHFQDLSLKCLLHPRPFHRVELAALYGDNRMRVEFEDPIDRRRNLDEMAIWNTGASASWTYERTDAYQASTGISVSNYKSNYLFQREDEEDDLLLEQVNKANQVMDVRWHSTHQWRTVKHHVRSGYSGEWQRVIYELSYQSVFGDYDEFLEPSAWTQALFADYSFIPSSHWSIQAGLRLSNFSETGSWYWEPRISSRFQVTDHLHLKAYAGQYYQFISQLIEWDFDLMGVLTPIWVLADDDHVPVISSRQFGIGLIYDRKGWLFDLELYQKNLRDLASSSPSLTAVPELEYAWGTGLIQGMDVLIKKRWPGHKSWISYSLSRILYDFPDVANDAFHAPHDQRHNLKINHLMQIKSWEIALGWSYRSGKPFTPRLSDSTILIEEDQERYWIVEPTLGEINSRRLPTYHRLDLSALYHLGQIRKSRVTGSIGGSILNLYNRENVLSLQYFPEYFEPDELPDLPESEELQKDLLYLLPNLLIRLTW